MNFFSYKILALPSKRRRVQITRFLGLVIALTLTAVMLTTSTPSASAQGSMQWYMVDTHTHSVVSSEAFIDVGIHSDLAKSLGYDAIFLTDHNGGSSFQINNLTANYMIFEDTYTRWESGTFGELSATVNELTGAPAPVNSGSAALHLRSASTQYGETHLWTKRGPNLRSGDIIIQVSIYPVRIDPNSGAYISVSLGGDPTTSKAPSGYTTTGGAISHGKSTVLVWQLGDARVTATDPNARVLTYPLSYTLNTWNHYTINVSAALNDIPVANRPLDYNAISYLKMAVGAEGGVAEAYFDTYSSIASVPVDPAAEYVYRTTVVDDFDTATYKTFPSYEAGQQRHTQRFNFGITNPADYVSYTYGSDSIPTTHQTGYPAQMNHPGVTVTEQDIINTRAFGADFLEVREDAWNAVWDAILLQDVPLIGTWSSDTHTGLSAGKHATFIYAPSLTFDALVKAYFEGRSYNARNDLSGHLIFSPNSATGAPYPSRYPIYVSDSATSAALTLQIDGGLSSSWTVRWIADGLPIATENPTGATYQATKTIPLTGATSFARAEVRSSSSSLRMGSQPILFRSIAGLPAGRRIQITEVTTANGRDYTNERVKGITAANWGAGTEILQLQLENPNNALTQLQMTTEIAPQRVKVNGVGITAAASQAAFGAATGNSWYYASSGQLLHIKVLQAASTTQLDLEFGNGSDTIPPTVPTNLVATAVNLGRIDLTWNPSTDNIAVAGYTIRRNGLVLTTVASNTVSFSDLTVQPATTYNYTVDAFDTAGNFSAQSAPATATTPNASTLIFSVQADTYVDGGNPSTNFGTATTLRGDASPIQRSYLRFDLQNLIGYVAEAKLRIFAETSSTIGYQIAAVSDNGWGETVINFNNAPAIGAVVATSGAYSANSWTEVDVTSLVTGNGLRSFALTTTSNTGLRYSSRESVSGNGAQLIVTVQGTPPDTPPTVNLTNPANGATVSGLVNVTANASDDHGVTQVAFFVGGVSIGVDTTAPYEAPWDTTTTANGTVTVSATATDSASQSSSSAVGVTVNNGSSSGVLLYVSSDSDGNAGGVAFADEDILTYDVNAGLWSMFYDGSDVSGGTDVNAFYRMDDGSMLLSFDTAIANLAGVGAVDDSDIVRFVPSATGATTAGTFSLYFRGADVGLTTNSEDISALTVLANGDLIVGTLGNFSVTGASGTDEDLIRFTPTTLGAPTSGTWAFYFDGSDVELDTSSTEQLYGVWIDESSGDIYLTTQDAFAVTGAAGVGSDIFVCSPGTLGATTSCTYSLFWNGAAVGLAGERIDALHIGQTSGVARTTDLSQAANPGVQDERLQPTDEDNEANAESDEAPAVEIYLPVIQNQ